MSLITVAKRGVYRAANSIFGKIGRSASEEVLLQLIANAYRFYFMV